MSANSTPNSTLPLNQDPTSSVSVDANSTQIVSVDDHNDDVNDDDEDDVVDDDYNFLDDSDGDTDSHTIIAAVPCTAEEFFNKVAASSILVAFGEALNCGDFTTFGSHIENKKEFNLEDTHKATVIRSIWTMLANFAVIGEIDQPIRRVAEALIEGYETDVYPNLFYNVRLFLKTDKNEVVKVALKIITALATLCEERRSVTLSEAIYKAKLFIGVLRMKTCSITEEIRMSQRTCVEALSRMPDPSPEFLGDAGIAMVNKYTARGSSK
ncbi:hypothetical protein BVRB_5g120750 [Beta vulgaris subsp. vulgaris]|nr:hypothetical protein BVRB_5g120750 [Beta vulgaris subsp. vulgaris]